MRVTHVVIPVADLGRAAAFLVEAAGFTAGARAQWGGPAWDALLRLEGAGHTALEMHLGEERLTLVQFDRPGQPLPAEGRSDDLAFQHVAIVVSDMERARTRLAATPLVSAEPQTIPESNRDAAGIKACYFLDPDRHVLEVISFPPDKGQARWHSTDRLHLGIDHTAIAVSSTDRSLVFWRDEVGLREVGHSHNVGVEQERLSGVPGADVRITALRGEGGIGVELLEYLHPRTGRAAPAGRAANDLGHVVTVAQCGDLGAVAGRLQADVVTFPPHAAHFRQACLVADPDGHAVLLTD